MNKVVVIILTTFLLSPAGRAQALKQLPLNEIKPAGWIKKQMLRDLSSGYISVYDQIQPNIGIDEKKKKKIQTLTEDSTKNWIARRDSWWSSCHQAYFSEGLVRNAFYTGFEPGIDKIKGIVDYVLKHQEKDGYMGIYDEDSRLDKQPTGNAELLVHGLMYNAILSYYEYTGEEMYLQAVIRAVNHTIDRFEKTGKTYFGQKNPQGGGLAHGLTFVDVLEWLYRITGDERYPRFAFWLYEDYNNAQATVSNVDNILSNLLDRDYLFREHAVHVVEHFRTPFWLSTQTDDPRYSEVVSNIFYKLNLQTTPTGAIVTDPKVWESVAGNYGSPDLPYEYCTITELAFSYGSAYQKFNRPELGDEIEQLVFNAGQGARFPDGKANRYLTFDNQYNSLEKKGFRYQYAACHRVACCNLECAKLMPHYVSHMWMKSLDNNALYALLYGPSEVTTIVRGTKVKIIEETSYPFENKIRFTVSPEKDARFSLYFRNPRWSHNTKIQAAGASVRRDGGYFIVTKLWQENDVVEIEFDAQVEAKRFLNNEFYIKRGALIYAMKIDEEKSVTKMYEQGFANYDMVPVDASAAEAIINNVRVPDRFYLEFEKDPGLFTYHKNTEADDQYPFDSPYGFIRGSFIVNGKSEQRELVPVGSTLLRKVTFRELSK